MPNVKVSDWVKTQLDEIKEARDHMSYDSAIRDLLREANYE